MKIKSKIKGVISKTIRTLYKLLYKYVPVQEKTVLFLAYHGRGYLCNPKAIHQYMKDNEEYKDYNFVWAVKGSWKEQISGAKLIRYNGLKYFYYLARSKYWIFNCKMPKYLLKKENQVYVQTWHGTPLKKLAHDINIGKNATFYRTQVTKEEMTKQYDDDVKKYDYFISPNEFSTEKFQSSFKIDRHRLIETGYPRNDFLMNYKEKEIIRIKEKYNIPLDKKVILYAPTWRDNSFNAKGYVFELKVNFNLWKENLGEDYVVIFKPHYLITNKFDIEELKGFLYTVSENEDINHLYVISDMLVTDYSSVFFDYANLKRPMYFYMYDLKDYEENLRGFYLDINKDLPGRVITEEKELLRLIDNHEEYLRENEEKIKEFNSIYNNLQDGQCCKRVLDIVIKSQGKGYV